MRLRAIAVAVLVLAGSAVFAESARAADPACFTDVTQSFVLSADKTCTGLHWIRVTAPNVIVDLGGHTVSGTQDSGVTVLADNVTVRNGTLDNFSIGVYSIGADTIVEGVRAINGGEAGIAIEGEGAGVVRGSIAASNTGTGFRINSGVERLEGNLAESNGDHGFSFGNKVKVEGNTAMNNGEHGFRGVGPGMTVSHNFAFGNTENGFLISADSAKVTGNVAFDNSGHGFFAPQGGSVSNNVAVRNGFLGGNDDNLGRGFEFGAGSAKGKGNVAARNDDPADCSLASACTQSADANLPLLPAACDVPVTQSLRLSGDVGPCSGTDGIVAGADNITIDLNGHRVFGNGLFGTEGINSNGHSGLKIRNGAVDNFFFGVEIASGSSKTLVEGIVATNTLIGFAIDGVGETVRGNLASIPTGNGFSLGGSAEKISLQRNASLTSGADAFAVPGLVPGLKVDTNIAGLAPGAGAGSGQDGFDIVSDKVSFSYNLALKSAGHGFIFDSDVATKLLSNRAIDNGADGFDIDSAVAWALTNNLAVHNSLLGFQLNSMPTPKAKDNFALLNDTGVQCSPQMTC